MPGDRQQAGIRLAPVDNGQAAIIQLLYKISADFINAGTMNIFANHDQLFHKLLLNGVLKTR